MTDGRVSVCSHRSIYIGIMWHPNPRIVMDSGQIICITTRQFINLDFYDSRLNKEDRVRALIIQRLVFRDLRICYEILVSQTIQSTKRHKIKAQELTALFLFLSLCFSLTQCECHGVTNIYCLGISSYLFKTLSS